MNLKHKKELEHAMDSLHFVVWDRFVVNDDFADGEWIEAYGWIDRDQDSYKDFVTLGVSPDGEIYYNTSSARYSLEIHRIIAGSEEGHVDCQRVENCFNVKRSIHLKS